jgi:hypothetical protein
MAARSFNDLWALMQPLATFPRLRIRKYYYIFMAAPVDFGSVAEKSFPLKNFRTTDFDFTCPSIRSRAECSTQTLQLLDTREFWLPGLDSN